MTAHAARIALLTALIVAYAAVLMPKRSSDASSGRVDPLSPQPRAVELAIEEGRFADALPVATELGRVYPSDPLVAYWLATIHRGLHRLQEEAAAWQSYVALSTIPSEACPAIAEVYSRLGDQARALNEYERCVTYDPREPERLIDLAEAYARASRWQDALGVYRRAAALDPHHPAVTRRIDELSRGGPDR